MMTPELYDELLPLFCQVANDVRRRNPLVGREDFVQECFVWALTHPAKLAEYREDEDQKAGDRKLYGALRNACRDYARRDKAARLGYDPDDEVFYTLLVLKDELLPAVYDEDSWLPSQGAHQESVRSGADPAHGNNWLATLVDVSAALRKVSLYDEGLIQMYYRDSWTQQEMADELGISQPLVSKRLDRAVKHVHEQLGGARPFVMPAESDDETEPFRARKAISNAHARAKTGEDYAA
jgi:RNA polymerase sigma factor (sigma-70 family)